MEVKMSDSQLARVRKQFLGPVEMGDAVQRFPCEGNVEQMVTLVSNETGIFYNIGFEKGIPNEISGNMADRLLNDFRGTFKIFEVNGNPYEPTAKEDKISEVEAKLKLLEQTVKVKEDTSDLRNTNRNAFTRVSKNKGEKVGE